jgi:hypothetical protein
MSFVPSIREGANLFWEVARACGNDLFWLLLQKE